VEVILSPGTGLDGLPAIVPAARELGLAVSVTIRSAFEGDPDGVLATCEQLTALGVDEICLDDSASLANPLSVRTFLQEAVSRTRPTPVALRLGDGSGLALANALTALKSGVRRFHATLGGLDGVASLEDLLYLIATLEVDAPADRDAVLAVAGTLATVSHAPLRSRTGALPTPKPTELGGTS
jgi:isopropylmalate/homocitrate/citramalate synthase